MVPWYHDVLYVCVLCDYNIVQVQVCEYCNDTGVCVHTWDHDVLQVRVISCTIETVTSCMGTKESGRVGGQELELGSLERWQCILITSTPDSLSWHLLVFGCTGNTHLYK